MINYFIRGGIVSKRIIESSISEVQQNKRIKKWVKKV